MRAMDYMPEGYVRVNGQLVKRENWNPWDSYLADYEKDLQGRSAKRDLEERYGFGSSSGDGSSSSSGSGSFGLNIGGFGGIDDITNRAKDLAQFRLGLDFQQMDKAAGLRENEAQNNFGRTTKLTDQTYNWQRLINQDTEGARTQRNTDQLNTQKFMQQRGIDQDNFATRRAIGLASRRLGG